MNTPDQIGAGKLVVALDAHGGDFGPAVTVPAALARFEPSKHNGAPLLGLRGVVVKSHGNAGRGAMANAIREALRESERHVPQRIEAMINDYSIEECQ